MKWNKNIEAIVHLAFWLLLLIAAVSTINQVFPIGKAFIISITTVLLLVGVAYCNTLIIIPRFFKKGKFVWYFLSVFGLLVSAVLLNMLLTDFFFYGLSTDVYPFNDSNNLPGKVGIRKWRIVPLFFITISVLFISTIYALTKEFLKKERRTTQLEKEKIKHELNFLRSQINPHFLFNALNNLHATVQLQPEKAGDFILKLGEMLRYVLEDCNKDKVSLADEISYIENYIFFQKQKDAKRQNISFQVKGDAPSAFQLEPMLFIPLVENAFEHSYTENSECHHIKITIDLHNGALHFTTQNNLPDENKIQNIPKRSGERLGIQNVKRRLELLYPNRHIFTHGFQGDEYKADLIIKNSSI